VTDIGVTGKASGPMHRARVFGSPWGSSVTASGGSGWGEFRWSHRTVLTA